MAVKNEALETYKHLMMEIRARNDALDLILENLNGLGPVVVRECCYLQLRFMCELIAMACVVAHDDLTKSSFKKLRKTWHAADILDGLERQKEYFFPRPARRRPALIGPERGHHVVFVEGQLDKAGLKKMWETCGRYLHRGTVNQLAEKQPVEKDYSDVREHQAALIGLLNQHIMPLRLQEEWLMCDMASGPEGKGLTVVIASSEGLERFNGPADINQVS